MQRRYCAACSADSRCNRFAKGLNQSYFSSINFQNASIRKQGCGKLALCNPAPSSSSINHCFLTCQHKLSGVRVSGQQPGWVTDIEHWFCHPYTRLVFQKWRMGAGFTCLSTTQNLTVVSYSKQTGQLALSIATHRCTTCSLTLSRCRVREP